MIDDFTLPKAAGVKNESFFKVLMAQIINSDLLSVLWIKGYKSYCSLAKGLSPLATLIHQPSPI